MKGRRSPMSLRRTARRRRPIYVESRIRAPMARLWAATQDPAEHQRWDVRFGTITYLPRAEGEPQRFTYSTTVAPGVTISGTGESLAERARPDGTRWSGLRFHAADRRSIIDTGAGYWRYVPTGDGIRFLTRYDYQPRWGRLGEVIDRWVFRPAFGWATAWSFDRLRLWLEDGTPPERSRDLAVAHATAVAGLAGVLACQGRRVRRGRRGRRPQAQWRDPAAPIRPPDRGSVVVGVAAAALACIALATREGRPRGRRPLRTPPDAPGAPGSSGRHSPPDRRPSGEEAP